MPIDPSSSGVTALKKLRKWQWGLDNLISLMQLCQFDFKTFAEGEGRSFEGLEGDGNICGIKKPVQSRAAGVHLFSHSSF